MRKKEGKQIDINRVVDVENDLRVIRAQVRHFSSSFLPPSQMSLHQQSLCRLHPRYYIATHLVYLMPFHGRSRLGLLLFACRCQVSPPPRPVTQQEGADALDLRDFCDLHDLRSVVF